MKLKLTTLFTILFIGVTLAQDCEPTKKSKLANGDDLYLYGGKIRSGGFGSNDKSVYSIYVGQSQGEQKATSLIVSLYEPVNNKNEYNNAVNNFLNDNNLKSSYLNIVLNGKVIKFKATSCTQQPAKLLGSIKAYTVLFQSDITKSQIKDFQEYDIQKFRLVIGGHPFERTFKKSTNKTRKFKQSMSCVDMDKVFELKKKDATEMDLTEVSKSDYSTVIKGKWLLQGSNGKVIEFLDGKFNYSSKGVKLADGSYKIVGNKIITTSSAGNEISEITLFLKDMMNIKDKKKESTYERID